MRFGVTTRTSPPGGSGPYFGAVLWNPHSSKEIKLREIRWFKYQGAGDAQQIVRVESRGTPTFSVTPNEDNCFGSRRVAPESGAVLDVSWSAQPSAFGAPSNIQPLASINLPGAIGSGFIDTYAEEIVIPPGEGIGVYNPLVAALQGADVTFVFDE